MCEIEIASVNSTAATECEIEITMCKLGRQLQESMRLKSQCVNKAAARECEIEMGSLNFLTGI